MHARVNAGPFAACSLFRRHTLIQPERGRNMTFWTRARYLTILLMLASAGCATAPPAPPTVDVTGVWTGTWIGSGAPKWAGNVTMTLEQKGAEVTGSLVMATPARNMTGPIMRGSVTGNEYRLQTVTGQLSGYLTVNGDDMSGNVNSLIPMDMKLHRER